MVKFTKNNIVEFLRKGDKRAYEEIYNDFFGVLYHLCIKYIHDGEVSKEIVQDSFVKLWEVRDTLDENAHIHNFLYTITKNNCLNYLRNQSIALKHQSNFKYLEMQFNYESLENLGNYLHFEELRKKIDISVNKLPVDIRETFVLSRHEELHYKEIAEKLHVSIKTVEARISKALQILRFELKEYLCIILIATSLIY